MEKQAIALGNTYKRPYVGAYVTFDYKGQNLAGRVVCDLEELGMVDRYLVEAVIGEKVERIELDLDEIESVWDCVRLW